MKTLKYKIIQYLRIVSRDLLDNIQREILLIILIVIFHFIYRIQNGTFYPYFLYNLSNATLEIFLFYISTSLFHYRIKNFLRYVFFSLILLDFLLNFGCMLSIGCMFNMHQLILILGTNKQEVYEFFKSYFSLGSVLMVVLSITLVFFLYHKTVIKLQTRKRIKITGIIFSLCVIFGATHLYLWDIFPQKEIIMFQIYEPTPDLIEYTHDVQIISKNAYQPKTVLFILGESFSKSHSSLYGYEKKTNPILEKLQDEGKLIVYPNVTSSAVHTIQAFKSIFSSYNSDTQKLWYDCLTLFDVIRSQYHIYWLSNQSSTGIFDQIPSAYTNLSDSIWYAGCHYDESVIPKLRELLEDTEESKFIIIHLLGQHENFYARYPPSFDRFKEVDYSSLPAFQRQKISEYDNATLYNDYVVSELFNAIDSLDALGIYFPDHGMDLYSSNRTYIGHAKEENSKSFNAGIQIPFMIYVNDVISEREPLFAHNIDQRKSDSLCTDSFVYFLCDMFGYKYVVKEK